MWLVAAVLGNIDLDPVLNMLNSETWSIFLALWEDEVCSSGTQKEAVWNRD